MRISVNEATSSSDFTAAPAHFLASGVRGEGGGGEAITIRRRRRGGGRGVFRWAACAEASEAASRDV